MTEEQIKKWLTSLEAERNDLSYRIKPAPPVVTPQIKKINNRYRDGVMFHAGRYAAGARDPEAVTGHRKAERILKAEQKNA